MADSSFDSTFKGMIIRDFELDESTRSMTVDEMVDQLRQFISRLIDENMELLFYFLYRIDLPESKVMEALTQSETPSDSLVDLIVDREKEKTKTRLLYQNDDKGDGWLD
jgi:hypothetical protein